MKVTIIKSFEAFSSSLNCEKVLYLWINIWVNRVTTDLVYTNDVQLFYKFFIFAIFKRKLIVETLIFSSLSGIPVTGRYLSIQSNLSINLSIHKTNEIIYKSQNITCNVLIVSIHTYLQSWCGSSRYTSSHSAKSELSFCASLSPAPSISKSCDGNNLSDVNGSPGNKA